MTNNLLIVTMVLTLLNTSQAAAGSERNKPTVENPERFKAHLEATQAENKRAAELQAEVEALRHQRDTAERQLTGLAAKARVTREANNALLGQVRQLYSKLREQTTTQDFEAIQATTARIAPLNAQVAQKSAEFRAFAKDIEQLNRQTSTLDDQLKAKEDEQTKFKLQLDSRRDNLTEQIARLQANLAKASLTTELNAIESGIENMELKLSILEDRYDRGLIGTYTQLKMEKLLSGGSSGPFCKAVTSCSASAGATPAQFKLDHMFSRKPDHAK